MRVRVPRRSLAALYIIVEHSIREFQRVSRDRNLPLSAKMSNLQNLNVPTFVEMFNEFVEANRLGAGIKPSSLNAMGVMTDRLLEPLREAGLLAPAEKRGQNFSPTILGEKLVTDRLRNLDPALWPQEMIFDGDRPEIPPLEAMRSLLVHA